MPTPRRRLAPTPALPYAKIASALRADARLTDDQFDKIYPDAIRDISAVFWTPVEVARQAARWLTAGGAKRVLDVGAGVGKFCIIGALVCDAEFDGVEHRPHLVQVARQAIAGFGSAAAKLCDQGGNRIGANIVEGRLDVVRWERYAAYYLFNPLQENLTGDRYQRFDEAVELSAERFLADLGWVQDHLGAAPAGTRVATYHGLGGNMPAAYQPVPLPEPQPELHFWLKAW